MSPNRGTIQLSRLRFPIIYPVLGPHNSQPKVGVKTGCIALLRQQSTWATSLPGQHPGALNAKLSSPPTWVQGGPGLWTGPVSKYSIGQATKAADRRLAPNLPKWPPDPIQNRFWGDCGIIFCRVFNVLFDEFCVRSLAGFCKHIPPKSEVGISEMQQRASKK